MSEICSDITVLDKNTKDIENELCKIYDAEVIRWAIVEVDETNIKICCSYKK